MHTSSIAPYPTYMDELASREVMADVAISMLPNLPATGADTFNNITSGSFSQNGVKYPHLSAHLQAGVVPIGGNILFKDGHAQWRKFAASGGFAIQNVTQVRAGGGGDPYFWW